MKGVEVTVKLFDGEQVMTLQNCAVNMGKDGWVTVVGVDYILDEAPTRKLQTHASNVLISWPVEESS